MHETAHTIHNPISRDLVHWRLLTRPLSRASQRNMLGEPDSCGLWAPCLNYGDGLLHLVFTDVKRFGQTTVVGATGASLREFHNYLVTSITIDGDWSDPSNANSYACDTTSPLYQRAGHADLVETQSGQTYVVYLCGRP